MQARTGISERRACQLIGLSRSVLRYQPRASVQNTELQAQLVELAQERRRFGYRRLHILLRRAGVQVNHKRIYRLYRAAGLMVKRRRRRHGVAVERERLSLPSAPNQVWSSLIPLAVLPWVTYLALPVSVNPLLILLPSAALLGVAVCIAAATFKKYL